MLLTKAQFLATVQGASDRWLPFADAATEHLPLSRLLRLSLFQITVGMSTVLLSGTLNRVMVVELGQAAWLVSLMVAIPLLLAPARALIGFRSDYHKSFLGWRRVPYLWGGSLLQFGGLAIMPFALIVMTEPHNGPLWLGPAAAMLAFVLVGAGMHMVQTAGLALATDLASTETRPRVVALLYVMLLLGMIIASIGFAHLLQTFDYIRLIKVLQGAAMLSLVLNVVALWKQEPRNPERTRHDRVRPAFTSAWRDFLDEGRNRRLLVALAMGTMGFAMQDVLLEPYGAQILGLSVASTTQLTALFAVGMLMAFAWASRSLAKGRDPIRIAGTGGVVGVFAFATVIFSAPLESSVLFRFGTVGIGMGHGLFAVGTLTYAMLLGTEGMAGLAIGAWGAVQTAATGVAIFAGGAIRDLFQGFAETGVLGPALTAPEIAYGAVYHIEIFILFIGLIALGPLVRQPGDRVYQQSNAQLVDFPG